MSDRHRRQRHVSCLTHDKQQQQQSTTSCPTAQWTQLFQFLFEEPKDDTEVIVQVRDDCCSSLVDAVSVGRGVVHSKKSEKSEKIQGFFLGIKIRI